MYVAKNFINCLNYSVADPDSGSGAFLTPGPGSGIRNRFFRILDLGSPISDPGSQTHIFESFVKKFWGKSSVILLKLAQIVFFSISKIK